MSGEETISSEEQVELAPLDGAATEAAPPEAEPESEPGLADLKAKLERAQADYQNLRRRMLKDQEKWETRAVCEFARKLLPVLDSFERAREHPGSTPEEFLKGLRLIQDQLRKALREQGIKKMDAEGGAFDPNMHEALSVFNNPEVPDQTVVQVLENGYRYRKDVIRTAKVIVSRGGGPRPEEAEEPVQAEKA